MSTNRWEDPAYRYGRWSGNERGHAQDPQRCVVEVWPVSGWIPAQCRRKRVEGLYCRQHAALRRGR